MHLFAPAGFKVRKAGDGKVASNVRLLSSSGH